MGEEKTEKELEEKIIQVNRVAKKTKGGNRIGFSVLVAVGDKSGHIGVGLGKAPEVKDAIQKGIKQAKKRLVAVPLSLNTVPHEVRIKWGAARLLMKPAPPGSGIIAGGSVRAIVELAGIKDISTKILGTSNKVSNVYATIEALKRLKEIKQRR